MGVLLVLLFTGVSQAQLDIPTEVPKGTAAVVYDIQGESGTKRTAVAIPAGEAGAKFLEEIPAIVKRNNLSFAMNFLTTEDYAKQMESDSKMRTLHKWNLIFVIERMRRTTKAYLYGFEDVPEFNKAFALMIIGRSMLHWARPGTWQKMQQSVDESTLGQRGMDWLIKRGVHEAWAKFSLHVVTNIAISTAMFSITQGLMPGDRSYLATLGFAILPNAAVSATVNRYTKMPGVNFEGGRVLFSPTQQFLFSAGYNIMMASIHPMLLEADFAARVTVSIIGVAGLIAFKWAPAIVDWVEPKIRPGLKVIRESVIPFGINLKNQVVRYNQFFREATWGPMYEDFVEWASSSHIKSLNSSSRKMCILSF